MKQTKYPHHKMIVSSYAEICQRGTVTTKRKKVLFPDRESARASPSSTKENVCEKSIQEAWPVLFETVKTHHGGENRITVGWPDLSLSICNDGIYFTVRNQWRIVCSLTGEVLSVVTETDDDGYPLTEEKFRCSTIHDLLIDPKIVLLQKDQTLFDLARDWMKKIKNQITCIHS